MERIYLIILVGVFLFLFIQIIRHLFIKGILHFRLLKCVYPNRLKEIKSYWSVKMILLYFKLDMATILWFILPIYFPKHSSFKANENASELNSKLLGNNKKIFRYLILYVVFMLFAWWFLKFYNDSDLIR